MKPNPAKVRLPPPNALDRAMTWLSPQRGLERYRARVGYALATSAVRQIDSLGTNRLRSEWSNITYSGDAQIRLQRDKARNIVRDLILNNPYAAGAIQRLVANIVGRGIMPQCAVQEDTAETEAFSKPPGWTPIAEHEARRFQADAEALFAEFADSCDVGDRLDFYGLQALVARSVFGDCGEVLVHLPELNRPGRPVGFAVELIEADRLYTPTQKISSPEIRDGVELDPATGAPKAYYVAKRHPGETGQSLGIGDYTRVERRLPNGMPLMLHVYEQRRPGQTRGLTPYAAALGIFEDLHRYWEAEIVAARVAACFAGFIKSPFAGAMQPTVGEPNDAGQREQSLEPGMIRYLAEGEDVTFGNPMRPNAQFGAFTEVLLRAIGVCLDLPFELIALNFSQTNYSSARAALLEARRAFMARQAFLIRQFCQPIWEMVITEGVARGRLTAPSFAARRRDWLAARWVPPSWGWVDPVKEEVAARESIKGFLSTHADELAAQGKDFDQTVQQIAREHKRLKELGLPSPWDAVAAPAFGASPAAPRPAADEDEDTDNAQETDDAAAKSKAE